jgi:predicted RecB family nuclease
LSVSPHRPNFQEVEGNPPASSVLVSKNLLPLSADPVSETSEPVWLTDDLLFQFQRCQRRAFLELYGNDIQRDPPSDYVAKLRQDSLAHRRKVLDEQPVHQPNYQHRDWVQGAEETLALMEQGVERITGGVLRVELENGLQLVSCPNLLIKQPGQSCFGDWVYVPADIRLGKRPKMDYQIVVAFHAYVLAVVQDAWPEIGWLLLRQRGACAVNLAETVPRMQEILRDCIQTLLQPQAPEVFIAHNRCDLCQWSSHCYELAQRDYHLSLLPGVTPSRYVHLKALGLTTLEALAATNPKQLETLPGFGVPVAHRLVRQAQSVLHNRALPNCNESLTAADLLTAAELPTAPIELYFDIEAAPEQNLIYLHGVLVVDRVAQTDTFYPLLADTEEQEEDVWNQFLDLVWRYPTAPIFHFCPYEVQTVKRLGEFYNTPPDRLEPLLHRFVDLHERVTRVAILPVESYALKPIARWIGFNWRNPEASGAQSIYWFAEWMATREEQYLNAILHYNEDDCRATYWVKNWLTQFCQLDNGGH